MLEKELGELCLIVTTGMVANAIYCATGVRIKELPMIPKKNLQALKGKRQVDMAMELKYILA